MSLIFSVPSKTFLAGEYLALEGGLTLLAGTEPRFELHTSEGNGRLEGIPQGSPAWRLIQRKADVFDSFDLSFVDPHAGAGGWGASTAQYLSCFALWKWREAQNDESGREIDLKELLENYREDAWNGEGKAPSGADLVGQLRGGFTFFERNAGMISRSLWPFENLDGYLLRTGNKIATHEHLKTSPQFNAEELATIMNAIRQAWLVADAEAFAQGLRDYGKSLRQANLVAHGTQELLHDLGWLNGVLAAKGCGALGADVVFVLLEKKIAGQFELWAEGKGLTAISVRGACSAGLEVKNRSLPTGPELEGQL